MLAIKQKSFIKKWNWKNKVACKISRFKSNWEYLGIVKMSSIREKLTKELIL